jgi:hypothetical protein
MTTTMTEKPRAYWAAEETCDLGGVRWRDRLTQLEMGNVVQAGEAGGWDVLQLDALTVQASKPDGSKRAYRLMCARCHRPLSPWPLERGDRCAPRDWQSCIRPLG